MEPTKVAQTLDESVQYANDAIDQAIYHIKTISHQFPAYTREMKLLDDAYTHLANTRLRLDDLIQLRQLHHR